MGKAARTALVVLLGAATAAGQTAVEGEISGRISDVEGVALPGVRISISNSEERREATTDDAGRFVLRSLKPGPYGVTAELPGFVSKSGTITLSPTSLRARIAWSLAVGCLAEVQRVIFRAREAAPLVDAIAHLRVESDDGPVLVSVRPECIGEVTREYTVQLLRSSGRRAADDGRSTVQILMSRDEPRLESGREYVALFWEGWRAAESLVLPIVSGRVVSPAGEGLNGMTVEDALAVLSRWSRERQP